MSHGLFRQADVQRLIRAAGQEGATIEVDLRTLVMRVMPGAARLSVDNGENPTRTFQGGILAPDGKENFDED